MRTREFDDDAITDMLEDLRARHPPPALDDDDSNDDESWDVVIAAQP